MAEVVISPIAAYVLEKLSLLVEEGISPFFGLEGELEKLKDTISKIQSVLLDADEKRELSHQEKELVRKLKDVLYDADDLLDLLSLQLPHGHGHGHEQNMLAQKVRFFFSKPKLEKEVKRIRGRIDSIVKDEGIQIEPGHRRKQEGLTNRETISAEHEKVIGRDEDAAAIKNFLFASDTEQDNVSVIAIVGIGGLGKTTLARHAFNDSEVKEYFQKIMWVCVSEEFDLEIIFGNIILSAGSYKPEGGMEPLQQHLQQLICEKKYLLVLDDVWSDNGESWKKLKAPLLGGGKGSKIVVTTRNKMVGNAAGATRSYLLKGLSEDDSWELFKKIAFDRREEESNDPELVKIGKQVVERCVGVPLAIKSMGALLSNKSYVEWQRIEEQELSSIIQGEENDIMPILKLSYDYLPPHLKQCFAYCSLFPKDYRIERLDLIRLWIANGFIQSSTTDLEDVGNHYFMHLLHMSFFQEPEEDCWSNTKRVKMHDFMHDLATEVAKSECLLVNDRTKSTIGKFRHVSSEKGTPMSLKDVSSALCKKNRVRTLLKFRLDSYSSFKHLRVLDLSNRILMKVPKSICGLKSLRYLNLSSNNLSSLPDFITRLQKLETLNLAYNYQLRRLPQDLKNLVNLRHLILDNCDSLIQMPSGIGKLSFLQTLSKFVVCSEASSKCSAEISELAVLNNLRGSLEIINSRNVRSYFKPDILKNKKGLEILTINFEECSDEEIIDDETLLEGALQLLNLKNLNIINYNAKKLQNAQSLSFELPRLIGLRIDRGKCKYLPDLGHLPNLKSIHLSCLTHLTYLSPMSHLSCLESIEIKELSALQEIPPLDKLHRLKSISFERLSAITDFPSLSHLSCLESIEIKELSALQEIPPLDKLHRLKSISFERLSAITNFPSLSHLSCLESIEIRKLSALQEIPPLDKLHRLKSISFESLSAITNFPSLPQNSCLESLYLWRSTNLPHLPSLIGLSYLKNISLGGLDSVEYIQEGEEEKHYPNCSHLFLPSLKNLILFKMPKLKGWWKQVNYSSSYSSITSLHFPILSHLAIVECPNLENMPFFPSVERLHLEKCNVKSIMQQQEEYMMNWVTDINNKNESSSSSTSASPLPFSKLIDLLIEAKSVKDVPKGLFQYFTSLKEICIRTEDDSETLPDSFRILRGSLQRLEISGNLKFLPDWIEEFTSLQDLTLHDSNQTVLPQGLDRLTSLRQLHLVVCSKLTVLPDIITALTSLQLLNISSCPELESFPDWMPQLTSLKELQINHCPKLERCMVNRGVDWRNISHIPLISYNGTCLDTWIQDNRGS